MSNYRFENNTFMIEEYDQVAPFSSFLPGIAGVKGIPLWCFYTNRGQGVNSFGVHDKDHAIMEFFPAHYAYQQTEFTGMRTFIKRNGRYFEAFAGQGERAMLIASVANSSSLTFASPIFTCERSMSAGLSAANVFSRYVPSARKSSRIFGVVP